MLMTNLLGEDINIIKKNTSTSYSEGPGLKSRLGDRLY
jgi:hypothetical protein